MMDCKKALVETGGDIDAAADHLRKAGQAKADKKASRVAAEGRIVIATDPNGRHALVEVNSETDFVANDENFQGFAETVASAVLSTDARDVESLLATAAEGGTIEELRKALVAKVGENITVRRFQVVDGGDNVGSYIHMNRIGVIVEAQGGDEQMVRDLAMQVAATSPKFVSVDDVPADELEGEREILKAQAAQEGKPPEIVEKMVEGRLRKHFDEVTLLGQPFVKNPDQRVRDLLKASNAKVSRFVRFEVGEGVEKSESNFADEVKDLLD